MASAALPPGFPAIEIEGEHYWDGGLVSNTPLQWIVDTQPRKDTLAFEVDLWSSRGEFPRNMLDVMTREREIRYSSRTRSSTLRSFLERWTSLASGIIPILNHDSRSKKSGY
jgi:NTE family protein